MFVNQFFEDKSKRKSLKMGNFNKPTLLL